VGIETAIIASLAATAGSIYTGSKQARLQKRAGQQAAQQAEQAQRQAEREFNRANQKTPDITAMLRRNRAAGSGGVGGTFLTGQAGAPVSAGMLGRSTLLGS
jgi:type II secretory pathway pseudopilin PulG